VDLSRYHGKRICILLDAVGRQVPACGLASYEQDDLLGRVLHIKLDRPAGSDAADVVDLFIAESQWNGEITTECDVDCDFCFIPASAPSSD
jgi:hypothetical protein